MLTDTGSGVPLVVATVAQLVPLTKNANTSLKPASTHSEYSSDANT